MNKIDKSGMVRVSFRAAPALKDALRESARDEKLERHIGKLLLSALPPALRRKVQRAAKVAQ